MMNQVTEQSLERLFNDNQSRTPDGQLQKAKEALRVVENMIGKQPWLTMVITIIDFQQEALKRKVEYEPAIKAVKAYFKAGGS